MHGYRVTSWLENCGGIVIRLRLRRRDYVPVCPAGLQYLAFPSLEVYQLSPASPLPLPTFPVALLHLFRLCPRRLLVLVVVLERGKKKIRDDCGCWLIGKGSDVGNGGERSTSERAKSRLGARSERREKLHPFESHPRTPSGLKKSIKLREARRRGR